MGVRLLERGGVGEEGEGISLCDGGREEGVDDCVVRFLVEEDL